MKMTKEMLAFIEAHQKEAFDLLVELAQIPAPSNNEEKRAAFCKDWLIAQGAKGVYIDEARNVIYPVGVTEQNPLMVFMAHSDVVFPDTDPLPLRIEAGKIHCPGVGDDTANVVALLMAAKYIAQTGLAPKNCGLLLVINAGEEGLGDLKGTRRLMADFGHRVKEFITFDGSPYGVVDRAVGSKRYRIEITTEGGHSLGNFGNRNAIAYLASLIDTLYTMKVPEKGVSSYNVGTISGGTSVNTIAQQAEMLYEFRSDEAESLAIMENHLRAALEFYRAKGVGVACELIGDRPCGAPVDEAAHRALIERAFAVSQEYYGCEKLHLSAASTDCNIPLSMGIPAICTGCVIGRGAHTREEWIDIASLLPGLKLCLALVVHHM